MAHEVKGRPITTWRRRDIGRGEKGEKELIRMSGQMPSRLAESYFRPIGCIGVAVSVKNYLCRFYYSISQKVITLSGRRFITISGVFITLSVFFITLSGTYYSIGRLLDYRLVGLQGVLVKTNVMRGAESHSIVIKPTITYMEQCWAVRKKDENRLHVAEMRMLRWIRGKTRKDRVRNQIIQEDAKMCEMSTFLRQKRLNLHGHIRRREEDNLSRKIMDMVVPGKRRRGRPRRRWIDNNREDMSNLYELT